MNYAQCISQEKFQEQRRPEGAPVPRCREPFTVSASEWAAKRASMQGKEPLPPQIKAVIAGTKKAKLLETIKRYPGCEMAELETRLAGVISYANIFRLLTELRAASYILRQRRGKKFVFFPVKKEKA